MKRASAAMLILCAVLAAAHAQQPLDVDALKQRAEARDRNATRTLAEAYYAGSGGVAQDFGLAVQYFQKLADLGDVRAMTTLGLMYARGIGVPKNVPEAMKKWRSAATRSHGADAGAAYNMAVVYLKGDEGVAQNPPYALDWMKRAAQLGHVLAQTDLGVMYMEGRGIASDDVVGAAWLVIAAERGDAGAQEKLKLYADRLTPEKLDEAYRRANIPRQRVEGR